MTDPGQVKPSLTDSQVVQFCRDGYLMFERVVPDEINRRVSQFIAERNDHLPLLNEDWFVEAVLLEPMAGGAVRSLLGKNFSLPIGMANHRIRTPMGSQNWHRDGGSRMGREVNVLQVFYYPQDTPLEMGPTEVLPGSHFFMAPQSWMGHYGKIRGAVATAAQAGSIFITAYNIWHRRGRSTATSLRDMLKYCYWRMVPPERDWIIEPGFDFGHDHSPQFRPNAPTFRQQFREWYDAAGMFYWLCGMDHAFVEQLGGQTRPDAIDWPPGYPIVWKPLGFHRF